MRIKVADCIEHIVEGFFEEPGADNNRDEFSDRLMVSVLEKAMKGGMEAIVWLEKHKPITIELTGPQGGWY